MKDKRKGNKRNEMIPTFGDVAALLDRDNNVPWLAAHLEFTTQGVRYDIYRNEGCLSKAGAAAELDRIKKEVASIKRRLERSEIRFLMGNNGDLDALCKSEFALSELEERAERAGRDPCLARNGRVKRGRGKLKIPGVYSAKTMTAARMLALVRFFWKIEPNISCLKMAEIAQFLWLASGGISDGYGDPRTGWKKYFKEVLDNSADPNLRLMLWRQELEQTARRGRTSKYVGSFFPGPQTEFRSFVSSS
jgi:hypothetical protein